ncbi:TonB-dependent receptor plug domain-containing protein [Chryseobacterium sp. SSA4.19]|uniref:TonB-dependent receptor plug domain-containing protein n=1 Tax=Chryseobacterium sp. SSA4.19 TaxID=2919915 RepID=UPI001F4DBD09|nr:TonB-dependent receptor plug domain-containing protein [Chryseobacterium sp. SSA4.19]MCJ8155322.1 TonB-dependent receptor plug domain-containing protein [Chryseobacterium sp. SSA4.19]
MENNHDIDKTFSEASKTLEEPATFPGFDKVWNIIEEKLDKKKDKKKSIPAWIPYGVAASLLIASGIFYFTDKKESNGAVHPVITQNRTHYQKSTAPALPEHILKLDSMVKSNVQKETRQAASTEIAYEKVPELYASPLSSPIHEMSVPASGAAPVAEKNMMDTVKRQNLEEVIAMGVRKERASMVNTVASSAKKKISDINGVADTAEVIYPGSASSFGQKEKEPEILAYNKEYANKHKAVASGSGFDNKLANKPDVNTLKGYVSGLNVSSGSEGVPVSGRTGISVRGKANTETHPLIVINGVYSDTGLFKKLDPKKIESVQVFKGDKAVSVFGSRAVNGVIFVVTKDISRTEKRKLKKLLSNDLLTN